MTKVVEFILSYALIQSPDSKFHWLITLLTYSEAILNWSTE